MAHEEEEEDGGSQVSMGLTKLDLCALRGGGGEATPLDLPGGLHMESVW